MINAVNINQDHPTNLRDISTFLKRIGIVICVVILIYFGIGIFIDKCLPWKNVQDIHQRILWDYENDTAEIVLLGDSVVCSYYVDNLSQTIWSLIETESKKSVFPAVLSGASLDEMKAVATYISKLWSPPKKVFIGLHPLKFMTLNKGVRRPVNQQHLKTLKNIISIPQTYINYYDWIEQLPDRFFFNTFFLFRNSDVLRTFVNTYFLKLDSLEYSQYQEKVTYNRVWNIDGDYARNRYLNMEKSILFEKSASNLQWIQDVGALFTEADMTPVFVLTPLNVAQFSAYSTPERASALVNYFNGIHSEVVNFLDNNKLCYIDAAYGFSDDCFADLIHTNAKGDFLLAQKISAYLQRETAQK